MLSCPNFVRKRQYGNLSKVMWKDAILSTLYKSFGVSSVTTTTPLNGQDWGAVFGCGFSPDGSLLVAACENKCLLVYDPHNANLIKRRFNTHTSCVNCVRFLDNRLFVTCSDDTTVRLWDARNLTNELKVLRGHTSWVKNIEYCSTAGKLITSGFDGNVFAWDINNYSNNDQGEQLLYINGMMRTKVCPDEQRMVISTLGGYFILVHDLDLDNFKQDLKSFRPRMYGLMQGLMQLLDAPQELISGNNNIFHRKRNRVEFMSDFPEGDKAVSISTMQVHPQGWCLVSRNTTADEETEVNKRLSRSNGDRYTNTEWPPLPHASQFHNRRLLFHSGEPNVGQGYIKEQSFSSDGRIIASPFANCVRLLAFDSECRELCDTVPHKPRPLRQVALIAGNKSSVLTSTFSPVQLLCAAGAEDGSISFSSPKL
ncbi:hypothetical protein EGW08_000681 [Elysia chlorotica]|uniref:Uncharacterized protein n=1 Tax=Elysia chlorotica TaxID=188477 RepID=A0A3S1BMA0_ELYCH|nr:hypothetical protein EGW08_000681 [Elysia chlorotica]